MLEWVRSLLNPSTLITVERLVILLLLTVLAARAAKSLTARTQARVQTLVVDVDRRARLRSLVQVSGNVAYVVLLILAAFMALHTLGLSIAPLLAGAGVAGLAVSLGAQTLIRDYIGGILILAEDQFRVGDSIQVGDKTGEVETITLRATYVRDFDGRLHIIPNGDLRSLSNLTRDWARAAVELTVPFDAQFGRVMRALETAAAHAADDPSVRPYLIEAPEAVGWTGFKDSTVQVRLTAKTLPGKQGEVSMALRRYAAEALQAEGERQATPAH